MDEEHIARLPGFDTVVGHVTSLIRTLAGLETAPLAALR